MQWLVLEATCSQGEAEALCEELRHTSSWVKTQNKTPKSKQTYRECYYRCLIKSSGYLPQIMLNSGGKKSQQNPQTHSLQFMNLGLPISVWGLIQVCLSSSHLRAPFSLSQLAHSTSPVHWAGTRTTLPDHGRVDLLFQAAHLHESCALVCLMSLPLSNLTQVR